MLGLHEKDVIRDSPQLLQPQNTLSKLYCLALLCRALFQMVMALDLQCKRNWSPQHQVNSEPKFKSHYFNLPPLSRNSWLRKMDLYLSSQFFARYFHFNQMTKQMAWAWNMNLSAFAVNMSRDLLLPHLLDAPESLILSSVDKVPMLK